MARRIDPRLRAELRNCAREIINRDRVARKLGISQDTIGEIERALVRAVELGQSLGDGPYAPPRPAHLGIDWEEVPARGREVLISLTYRSERFPVPEPIGLCVVSIAGRERWAQISADGRRSDHSVAATSVNPLVRAGLLESGDEPGILILSAKGRATCEAYWRRRAADDPTLPKESIG